jgi:hypothetical protein
MCVLFYHDYFFILPMLELNFCSVATANLRQQHNDNDLINRDFGEKRGRQTDS